MAKERRTWPEVTSKLEGLIPLEFAAIVPADRVLFSSPGHPMAMAL
jgi:hypothetical protein